MCGIVGVMGLDRGAYRVDPALLRRMRDSMEHRGPDGSGLWMDEDSRIGLAHRRLSIIDLTDAAAQPMSTSDRRFHVVFNGEIYNHAALRRELEASGRGPWRTDHSDTEVILHAFAEWGIDSVERLHGMFAFALWDAHERELWLVRDRLGIKPLYVSELPDRVAFASEIKALLEDPAQPRRVDEEAIFHYLSFLTTPAPATLFDGIRKLPAATWMRVGRDGSTRQHQYWDMLTAAEPLVGVGEPELLERIRVGLDEAVQLRKVSDVPAGVFLSGGVDSSANALLFGRDESRPVSTFSIGYGGGYSSYGDELPYARDVAQMIGADQHERILDVDDLLDFLPRMIHLQDEPIADPVCVPLYYVSQLARDNGVIVCQLGEGADELFCGYSGWSRLLRLQAGLDRSRPLPVARAGMAALAAAGRRDSMPFERLRRAAAGQPVAWGGAEAFTQSEKVKLISPRMRERLSGMTSWEVIAPLHAKFTERAWEPSDLNWMTYLDLNMRLPELLLMRADKMCMGASVEGRLPFLDHKFVELVMSIPTSVKLGDGTPKYLLKKALRGVLPDRIIDRKKQGFGVPMQEWVIGRLRGRIRTELAEFTEATDFLDPKAVEATLQAGSPHKAWYLLNLALWWKAAFK
jgi:asparagine synthase (glutamine-hydrolysing)